MGLLVSLFFFFFFNDTATTEIYTLSLHDALPIFGPSPATCGPGTCGCGRTTRRSEEHTSELQSRENLVCRLLLEKKKKTILNRKPQLQEARMLLVARFSLVVDSRASGA